MGDAWITPGQAAHEAFDLGVKAAVLAGLAILAGLYWAGVITPVAAVVIAVAVAPLYLVFISLVLCQLLGLDPDITDLRPVRPK